MDYKKAGVDIDAGNEFVRRIRTLVRSTFRPEVLTDIGGFGGLFRFDPKKYRDPVLVSGTDGVGTKLKIASLLGRHDTVGIDLVAEHTIVAFDTLNERGIGQDNVLDQFEEGGGQRRLGTGPVQHGALEFLDDRRVIILHPPGVEPRRFPAVGNHGQEEKMSISEPSHGRAAYASLNRTQGELVEADSKRLRP